MRRAIGLIALVLVLGGPTSSASPDRDRSAQGPVLTPISLAFPTRDDGWVLSNRGWYGAELLATRDAGATWVAQWSGDLAPEQVVATADRGRIWREVAFRSS